jgi:hypothetical protein
MPPSRRAPPRSSRGVRHEVEKPPWWQHWYVAAAAVPVGIGLLLCVVMVIQRLAVGSSNFYVATLQKAQANPIVVAKCGNGIEVDKVQVADIPLFGGKTKLVLIAKGSRGTCRIIAEGHADSFDNAEMTRFVLQTEDWQQVDLLRKHSAGL